MGCYLDHLPKKLVYLLCLVAKIKFLDGLAAVTRACCLLFNDMMTDEIQKKNEKQTKFNF